MKKLEEMLSLRAYNEIIDQLEGFVGKKAANLLFPGVKKALEEGDGEVRESILREWLDVDYIRVCTQCGNLMEEGWYLADAGYACCDECAAKSEGITMEQFKKWRIYKDDIINYMKEQGWGGTINDLTQAECDEIIDKVSDDCDYCWTEWY